MKLQIRRGVFETNSSSVHSITMCSAEKFQEWRDGKVLYQEYSEDEFVDAEKYLNELRKEILEKYPELEDDSEALEEKIEEWMHDDCTYGYEDYPGDYYETFYEKYKQGKEEIVAFGYYGRDY